MSRSWVVVGALAVLIAGCGEKTFDPPDRDARVAMADSMYRAVRFDTVTYASEEERAFLGNEIYAARCRDCHGTLGRGETPYAQNRGIAVPSLVEPEWRMASSIDSVRHRVFVGHAAGMPTWGVAGLSIREIDAVAAYVLEVLRPDVLNDGVGRDLP